MPDMYDTGVVIPSPSMEQRDFASALVYTHPEYNSCFPSWAKYSDCYEAENLRRYIKRHERESQEIFDKRAERLYYYNYCASVIDLFIAYLFHAPIQRNLDGLPPEEIKKFYEDATRSGDTYHVFIQRAATFAQIFGHCGVIVDMPGLPEEGYESEEDRKKDNHRPYVYLVDATQILDWNLDDDDNFDFVKIELFTPDKRNWNQTVDETRRVFLIYSKVSWEMWEYRKVPDSDTPQITQIGGGSNPLNEVPLVVMRGERSVKHAWMGISTIRDISDINIGILNWSSLGDEEIYERCLNVLTMQGEIDDPGVELTHHNALLYAPGMDKPEYLQPGTSPLDLIAKWIDSAVSRIYTLAKLGGASGIKKSQEATSGIAYAFEFNETNQSLARKAECLEQAEIEIHRLFGLWMKQEFKGNITYAREFGVDDFLLELQLLTQARSTLTSETAIKEIESGILQKMFARRDQAFRDKLIKEVKEANPAFGLQLEEEQKLETQRLAKESKMAEQKAAQQKNTQQKETSAATNGSGSR